MTISLEKLGKRFNREWIFKNLTHHFAPRSSVAITGPNGSGKSTLLQIIAGNLLASEGKVCYVDNKNSVPEDQFYKHIAFSAPYLDIIEDFTLEEFLNFHFKFKPLRNGLSLQQLPELMQLPGAVKKPIKDFSTGMKQRVKLGICFYSDCQVLLLDEPATNLDKKGIDWYLAETERLTQNKSVFVSSNVEHEYAFCRELVDITKYKK